MRPDHVLYYEALARQQKERRSQAIAVGPSAAAVVPVANAVASTALVPAAPPGPHQRRPQIFAWIHLVTRGEITASKVDRGGSRHAQNCVGGTFLCVSALRSKARSGPSAATGPKGPEVFQRRRGACPWRWAHSHVADRLFRQWPGGRGTGGRVARQAQHAVVAQWPMAPHAAQGHLPGGGCVQRHATRRSCTARGVCGSRVAVWHP